MSEIYIGIDLGGTNIKLGCFDSQLRLIRKTGVTTEADMGPEVVVEKMGQTVERLLSEAGFSLADIAAAGLGTPGPAKYDEGIIIQCCNLPEFKDVPIKRMLTDRFGCPVVVENDANAACWGEFTVGAGKGVDNMVFFTLGTGIGGGLVCAGQLVRGCDGNGAELGHIIIYPGGRACACGQKGCVEAYASASSTAGRALEALEAGTESSLQKILKEKGQVTCRDVFEHSKAGDELAKEVTEGSAEALGIVCVNMLHVHEPGRIVFAGGMIAAGNFLLDRIRHYFNKHIWNLKKETVEICFAALGEDAGIIGAAGLAMHEKQQGDYFVR